MKLAALFLRLTKRSFDLVRPRGDFNLEDESSVTSPRKCRTRLLFHAREVLADTRKAHTSLSRSAERARLSKFQGATRARTFSVSISIDLVTRKCVLLSLLSFPRLPAVLSLSVEKDSKSGVNLRRIQPIPDITTPRASRSRVRTLGTRRARQKCKTEARTEWK